MSLSKKNYVFIDYENVQVKSLDLLKNNNFHIIIFLGKTNTKLDRSLAVSIQEFGEKAQYIVLETSGKNALDFHIAYYIGQLSISDPTGFFHVISKDTGFDPLLQHLKSRNIFTARSESIETMPCFIQKVKEPEKSQPKVIQPISQTEAVTLKSDKFDHNKVFTEYLSVLIKRHPANPKTLKGLQNHMKSNIDQNMPNETFQKLLQALISKKYLSVNEKKISYSLPKK